MRIVIGIIGSGRAVMVRMIVLRVIIRGSLEFSSSRRSSAQWSWLLVLLSSDLTSFVLASLAPAWLLSIADQVAAAESAPAGVSPRVPTDIASGSTTPSTLMVSPTMSESPLTTTGSGFAARPYRRLAGPEDFGLQFGANTISA